MRYVIKQKWLSIGDKYYIRNSDGEDVFFVKGRALSLKDKLSFQDMDGNELAFISQKLLSWTPTYEIHRNGNMFATVVKEFSWFSKKFTLDVPGPNDYTIDGSFWEHEYSFVRQGRQVARVSKSYFSWSDTYGIDIISGEDDISILACVVVIDQVLHDEKSD